MAFAVTCIVYNIHTDTIHIMKANICIKKLLKYKLNKVSSYNHARLGRVIGIKPISGSRLEDLSKMSEFNGGEDWYQKLSSCLHTQTYTHTHKHTHTLWECEYKQWAEKDLNDAQ